MAFEKEIPRSLIDKVIKYKYKNKVKFKNITYIKVVRDFFDYLKKEIIRGSLKEINVQAIFNTFEAQLRIVSQFPNEKNQEKLIEYISNYIKERLEYMAEIPNLEVVNVDIPYILSLPRGEKFYGDCDDTAFLICTIFIIINRWYRLGMKISLVFTSHMKGKSLHHAYSEIELRDGKKFIIDLVRKKKKKLPIFARISYTFSDNEFIRGGI